METEQNVEYPRRWARQIDTNTFKVTTHYKHIEFVEQASTLKEADDKLCLAMTEARKAQPKEYFGYTVKYWKVYGFVLALGLVGLIVFCTTHAKNEEQATITVQQDEALKWVVAVPAFGGCTISKCVGLVLICLLGYTKCNPINWD